MMLTLRIIQFCHANDKQLSNHAMLLVQLGINAARPILAKFPNFQIEISEIREKVKTVLKKAVNKKFRKNMTKEEKIFQISLVLLISNCTRHRMKRQKVNRPKSRPLTLHPALLIQTQISCF